MKKAERRRLKESGIKPQKVLKAIHKYKEGSFTYNPNEFKDKSEYNQNQKKRG